MLKLTILVGLILLNFKVSFLHAQSTTQYPNVGIENFDPENSLRDLGLYYFLLEVANTDKIDPNSMCIQINDSNGKLSLDIGTKLASFGTGDGKLSETQQKEYESVAKNIYNIQQMLSKAGYTAKLTIRSYADAQSNAQARFTPEYIGRQFGKKLATKEDLINFSNEYINKSNSNLNAKRNPTASEMRNLGLAGERVHKFYSNINSSSLSSEESKFWQDAQSGSNNNISTESYFTDEVNHPTNKDCAKRRSLNFSFGITPKTSKKVKSGTFIPQFSIAKGNQHRHMLIAQVLSDNTSYQNNIIKTQNPFTKFKTELKSTLDKIIELPPNINLEKNLLEPMRKSGCTTKNSYHFALYEKIQKYRDINKPSSSPDQVLIAKQEIAEFIINSFLKDNEKAEVKNLNRLSTNNNCSVNQVPQLIFNKTVNALQSNVPYLSKLFQREYLDGGVNQTGVDLNSSHFNDNMSLKSYYLAHFNKFTTKVNQFTDQNGTMKTGLKISHLPNSKDQDGRPTKGFACSVCGSGLHYHQGQSSGKNASPTYLHRTDYGSDYSSNANYSQESKSSLEHYHKNPASKNIFAVGQAKYPYGYIVKDCDPRNLDKAKIVDYTKLGIKSYSALGPNDCIFTPPIYSSCNFSPKGTGSGQKVNSQTDFTYKSIHGGEVVMGNTLLNSVQNAFQVLNNVNPAGKTCNGPQDRQKIKDAYLKKLESILCTNKNPDEFYIPKPSFDGRADCD